MPRPNIIRTRLKKAKETQRITLNFPYSRLFHKYSVTLAAIQNQKSNMKLSQSSLNQIEKAIGQAIAQYRGCEENIVTDIHLQANPGAGELIIFDDDDTQLAATTVDEWINYDGDDFYADAERALSPVLNNMKAAGDLEKLTLMKPYSFVLVDDDKETVAELLLVDDDTLLLNDELLKGLDEELDAFLKDLLEK